MNFLLGWSPPGRCYFRTVLDWVGPLIPCHRFWLVCKSSTVEYQNFNIALGTHQLLDPTTDLCTWSEKFFFVAPKKRKKHIAQAGCWRATRCHPVITPRKSRLLEISWPLNTRVAAENVSLVGVLRWGQGNDGWWSEDVSWLFERKTRKGWGGGPVL